MTMTTMTRTVEGRPEEETARDQRSTKDDEENTAKISRTDSWANLPPTWSCCMNTRACPGKAYNPTPIEHVANTLSHGLGVFVSLFYMSAMLSASHRSLQFYIALVYGVCTTLLFLMSTVYHYYEMLYRDAKLRPTLRYYLHITDRTAIYLFIAASYTPWLTLRHCGFLGLNAKWATWTAALGGMAYQIAFHERYKRLELAIYIVVAAAPAAAVLTMNDWAGLDRMAAGGVIYLVGVVFFKLDGVVPFAHAIWHLHVLADLSFLYSHSFVDNSDISICREDRDGRSFGSEKITETQCGRPTEWLWIEECLGISPSPSRTPLSTTMTSRSAWRTGMDGVSILRRSLLPSLEPIPRLQRHLQGGQGGTEYREQEGSSGRLMGRIRPFVGTHCQSYIEASPAF